MASPTKAFRFTPEELDVLRRLSERMECTETDVVRWGMAALIGLLHDGLESWTDPLPDGRRSVKLEDVRGRSLRLWEREKAGGGFFVGSWTSSAYWEADAPPDEELKD